MEEYLYRLYGILGEFFTGWHKKRLFYLGVFLGLVVCLILQARFHFIIEAESLSWFLSSIVQSLLALVALMGVVVVFRYQSMLMREDRLLEELNKDRSDLAVLGQDLTSTSGEELLEVVNRIVPDVLGPEHGFRIVRLHKVKRELESQKFIKGFLGQYMFKFSIYSFFVALLCLIGLAIVPLVTSIPFVALTLAYVFLFLVADIFRLIAKGIATTLLH